MPGGLPPPSVVDAAAAALWELNGGLAMSTTASRASKSTALRAEAAVFVPSAAVVFVQPWIVSGWHNGSACEQSRREDRRRSSSRRSKFRGRAVCPTSYLSEDGELFASERQGFMAAGALLWRRDGSGNAVALMVLQHGHRRRPSSRRAGQVRLEPSRLRSGVDLWATVPLRSLSDARQPAGFDCV